MRETLERMLTRFREYWVKLSRKTKIQIGVLAGFVITFAIVTVVLLTRTNYVVLPGTGDPANTAIIHAALVEMGRDVRVEGNVLLVPEAQRDEIQMLLRERGIMGPAALDMDILDGATGFGVTENHARQLSERQRAADIRTQIMQSPRIQNAIVIVNFGETSVFRLATNLRPPSASVQLTIAGGGMLTQAEAQAIAELVRGGVPGIEYQDIFIIDTSLNFYPVGEYTQNVDVEFAVRLALANQLRLQTQTQVEQLLSPIFGMSNIQIQPNVRLNFDRIVTESVEFNPPVPGEEGGIIRSREEVIERSRRWAAAEGIPGTDTNAMGSIEYPWGTFDDQDLYMRNVFSANYEINETRRMIDHAQGVVEDFSIAVLINSAIEEIEDDFTEEVRDLVSNAIGVAPTRISVQMLPFYDDPAIAAMLAEMEAQERARRNRELIEMIVMYAVIVLLAVMLFILVRTTVKALKPQPIPEPALVAAGAEGIDYLIDDDEAKPMEYEDVDLTAKSPGLEQVERFIDKDPASVAQLLRNWLTDDM